MKSLTVAYISARRDPLLGWFMDSLTSQLAGDKIAVQYVGVHSPIVWEVKPEWPTVEMAQPKPTVWQGPHRLTKEDWWAVSNARNTAVCLCKTEWIAFCDDRCVLLPGWLDAIRRAIDGNYAVFGAYEKRTGMRVANGVIVHGGIVTGEDSREAHIKANNLATPYKCPGEWAFGCNLALPLEWALRVNGYEELMDGLSAEDVVFGKHLQNRGLDIRYDPSMKIIEDRTPEELGTPMKRTSKERWPHDSEDKGHKALAMFCKEKQTLHQWNLRGIRHSVLRGEPWPVPTSPTHDWFDGQALAEM
jgi:hypothetical protein